MAQAIAVNPDYYDRFVQLLIAAGFKEDKWKPMGDQPVNFIGRFTGGIPIYVSKLVPMNEYWLGDEDSILRKAGLKPFKPFKGL